jgi:hypothetical protein
MLHTEIIQIGLRKEDVRTTKINLQIIYKTNMFHFGIPRGYSQALLKLGERIGWQPLLLLSLAANLP